MDDRGSIAGYYLRKPQDVSVLSRSSSITTPRRNMMKEFQLLAGGQAYGKNLDVYVRVKPGETEADESVLQLDNNSIVLNPPLTSFASKGRAGSKAHKFTFTKVFGPTISQKDLFEESILKLTDHFLHGQNTLVFTYGATSAGKTFTMHGSASDLGILPRSLDVIFNSIGEKQMENIILKPQCLDDIVRLSPENAALEDLERSYVLNGTDSDVTGSKESLLSAASLLNFKEWKQREKITTRVGLDDDTAFYSVWVSFAEIYNEQVFDLLEKYQRNKKPEPLRVAEDKRGKTYIKGLKEVCVRSADEAYHVIQLGKENLHFAATKLNHNSSRSHCVFTIKVIRTSDPKDPKEASLSLMSFCDLAGMERTGKTDSKGDRLKEAGNINTSLLVLGRCLDAIRQNRAIVPFRESKLTRLLQVYFTGQSYPAMMLNVSQSALLFDETLGVLKFGAKAEEIIIAPKPDNSVIEVSVNSAFVPPARPTKFMQFVRKSFSRLSARPFVREIPSLLPYDEEKEILLQRLQEAEVELARVTEEKQNLEVELRYDICTEWEQFVEQLNASWQKRLADTRALYEKSCENKLNTLAEYANKCLKRKRSEEASQELNILLGTKDDVIQELEADNALLVQQVAQLQQSLQTSEARQADLQCQLTRLRFEKAVVAQAQTTFTNDDLPDEDSDADTNSNSLSQVRQKLATNQEMLEEAAVEFQAKCQKVAQLEDELEKNSLKLAQISEENADLKEKHERIEYLLRDACDRLESKEADVSNLEEKLNANVGLISQLNSQLRLHKRTIRELEAKNTPAASWEEKYGKLSADHDRLVQKLSSMENTMTDSSETDKLNKELLRLEIRLREAEETIQLLQKLTKEAEDDHQMEKENLMDELNHLKKDLELSSAEKVQADQDVSTLRTENKDLRDYLLRVLDQQNVYEKERTGMAASMEKFEATISELGGELQKLKTEKQLADEEISTLAASLGRVQSSKTALEAENRKLNEQVKDLGKMKDGKEQLEGELSTAMTRIEDLEQQVCRLTEGVKVTAQHSEEQVVQLERAMEELKCQLGESEAQLILKTKRLAEVQEESNKAKGLQNDQQELLKNAESLEQQLSAEKNFAAQLFKEKTELEGRLGKTTAAMSNVQEVLTQLEHKYETLETSYEQANKTMLQYLRQAETLTEENKELKRLHATSTNKVKELEQLKKRLVTLEKELATEKENLASKDDEISRLQRENKLMLSAGVDVSLNPAPLRGTDGVKTELISADEDVDTIPPTPQQNKGRGGRKITSKNDATSGAPNENDGFARPSTTSRARRQASSKTVASQEDESTADPDEEPVKVTRKTRATKTEETATTRPRRGRPPKVTMVPSSDNESEPATLKDGDDDGGNSSDEEDQPAVRKTRGKGSTSARKTAGRSTRKVNKDSEDAAHPCLEIAHEESDVENDKRAPARPTRTMYNSRTTAAVITTLADVDDEPVVEKRRGRRKQY